MYTFGKGDLSNGVHGVDFGCTKSRIKENLKRVAWGLDVGHEDRTRINPCVCDCYLFCDLFSFIVSTLFL